MKDYTKDELLKFLEHYSDDDGGKDDKEVAIYWFASHYHSGQTSNLYNVLSTSPYTPGRYSNISNEGVGALLMYSELVDWTKE